MSIPTAYRHLVDDAAIFPPGLMPLEDAVPAHARHLGADHAALVGPFVVDAARLPRLRDLVTDGDRLAVSLVVPAAEVRSVLADLPAGVDVVALEVKLDPGTRLVPQLDVLPDREATVLVEVPRPDHPEWPELVGALAARGLRAKLRTGGTEAEAFPSEDEVATWVHDLVALDVPFKCTAGLHHAVRHRDAATGFEHHGYLNVLLATVRARTGADLVAVRAALAEQDPATVVAELAAAGPAVEDARDSFTSYGSCSITEPLDDLTDLGLLGRTPTEGDPLMSETWVDGAHGSAYDVDNLPYAIVVPDGEAPQVGVRIGDHVLLAGETARALRPEWAPLLDTSSLNPLLAAGRDTWTAVRTWLQDVLTDDQAQSSARLVPVDGARLVLPFEVADYVDYYASIDHATNVGRIFRPDGDALMPNWRHLPVGYHGRAGSVVVSGTPVKRPSGQRKAPSDDAPTFGPSRRLDIEAELGFVVGRSVPLGQPIGTDEYEQTVFGVVGLNDWSARDIQAWEYVPLGPNLGKSFATSISAWVTPLDALEPAVIDLPEQDPPVLPYLQESGRSALDIDVEVELNGTVVSRPPYASMYWSPAQMLAHLSVNGASVRVGDLFGSGTISGPEKEQRGSLLELTWGGTEPLVLDGCERTFLEDGDEVVLRYSAPGRHGRIGLGEVRGTIVG